MKERWLAPLRGVTIRAFRETYAAEIEAAGFTGAFAPFIPANPGMRYADRLFDDLRPFPAGSPQTFRLVPQVIGKDPRALREFLKAVKDRGFARADLNAGCPFPMIRRKGRGSGLLATPDTLEKMLEAGCDEMGPGCFSLKTRLGVNDPDEIFALLPRINRYPLACFTLHARTARQMYEGVCDVGRCDQVARACACPFMPNGDLPLSACGMIGRAFIRDLGMHDNAPVRLRAYMDVSRRELCGERPVLGRVKELVAYWVDLPRWRRLWPLLKIARSIDEFCSVLPS